MGRQHDLQKAYAVAHKVETPIHEAWRLFHTYADKIKPSRENTKGRGTVTSRAVHFASSVLRRFGPGAREKNENAPWEMVDIYYIYVDDDSDDCTAKRAHREYSINWWLDPWPGQTLYNTTKFAVVGLSHKFRIEAVALESKST